MTPIVFNVQDNFFHNKIFFICDCEHDKITEALHPDFQMEGLSAGKGDSGKFFPLENKQTGVMGYLIWIEKRPRSLYDMKILVHEINHLVIHALGSESLGVEINHDNSEVYTYYSDYLMTKILTGIKSALAAQKKPNPVKKAKK